MNPCAESMTRLQIGSLTIRIWRTEASLEDAINAVNLDIKLWSTDVIYNAVRIGKTPDVTQLFGEILNFERVSAVEILDEHGNGSVFYADWP